MGAWRAPRLDGKVALVAGATRGAGRGIATALGEAGATVYCTGRTSRAGRSPMGRAETIEETAERVSAAGGRGIPVRVDHLREDEVRALMTRIEREHGGLDILVNDIWGGDPDIEWNRKLWELDMEKGWRVIETALRTHLLTARHAAPLLMKRPGSLLVEITDGDSYSYRGNLVYDLVKTTVIRLAFDMAEELRPHRVAAVAVTPGFLRSEAMLEIFGVTEETWREGAKKDPNFIASETPRFVGRAVASLAADPHVMTKSGRVHGSWTLSDEYGFPDIDGSRPHWGRQFERAFGKDAMPRADDAFYRYWKPMEGLNEMLQNAFPDLPS